MHVMDLTQTIGETMPVYPGTVCEAGKPCQPTLSLWAVHDIQCKNFLLHIKQVKWYNSMHFHRCTEYVPFQSAPVQSLQRLSQDISAR